MDLQGDIYTDQNILYFRIMRGLPGSGKTTTAKELAKLHNAVVYSADDFHIKNNIYHWDVSNAQHAHKMNKKRTIDALKSGISVYYDNINSTYRDFFQMAVIANKLGAKIEIIQPNTTWCNDAQQCHTKSTHNIDMEKMNSIQNKFVQNIDINLLHRLITEYNTILDEKKQTSISFYRNNILPWSHFIQMMEKCHSKEPHSMKCLVLALCTMIPPMCDPCTTICMVNNMSLTDKNNNFYVIDSVN